MPRSHTPAARRATLTRITLIHQKLRVVKPDGLKRVTRPSLAADLETSVSTIDRDLTAMRVEFGAPIEWNDERQSYYYSRAFELQPLLWLDGRAVRTLMTASLVLGGYRGFPLHQKLAETLAQITPLLGGVVSLQAESVAEVLTTASDPANEREGRHFDLLYDAIVGRRVVRIVYLKPEVNATPTERLIHPLHLFSDRDGCLVYAHDPSSKQGRCFDLMRIEEAEVMGETFGWPEGLDLKKVLKFACGRFLGESVQEVRIHFDAAQVPYVKQRPWHSTQVLTMLPDGSAEGTYQVSHTQELQHRVLACGGRAQVIGPLDFRQRVRVAAAALLAGHG